MKLSGSYRFDVPRERLWATLMEPAVVGSCIPGVRAFTPLSGDRYEIELGVSVGIVSGASTPESLVEAVVAKLEPSTIVARDVVDEDVTFVLPRELRGEAPPAGTPSDVGTSSI